MSRQNVFLLVLDRVGKILELHKNKVIFMTQELGTMGIEKAISQPKVKCLMKYFHYSRVPTSTTISHQTLLTSQLPSMCKTF